MTLKNNLTLQLADLEKVDSRQLLSRSSVWKLFRKSATTLFLMIGVLVSSVSAEPTSSGCPPEWSDIVESVGFEEEDVFLPVPLLDRSGNFTIAQMQMLIRAL